MSMSEDKTPSWFTRLIFGGVLALLLGLLIVVALAGIATLAYEAHHAGRIYRGISILGVEVGGLNREQARDTVQRELGSENLPYVSLSAADRNWTVSLHELGGYLELDDAVDQAWALGRSGVFRQDLQMQAQLLWRGYDIIPGFHLEPGQALMPLRQIAREASYPARRAQLVVSGLQARSGKANTGREMDIVATRQTIERQVQEAWGTSHWEEKPYFGRIPGSRISGVARFPVEPIPIRPVFREVLPPLTESAGAQERVDLILGSPLTLTCSFPEFAPDGRPRPIERRWSIDQATLASWISLRRIQTGEGMAMDVGVDTGKIGGYVQQLAAEVARAPREARFDYDPGAQALTVLAPGQHGYALDSDAAQALIAAACLSSQREITLPLRVVPPRVTRADLEALLPLGLLAEGESGFRGSTPARLQNIRVATARFHGLAVPPRSTFSFVQNLGPVTMANGYTEAWIIYGDRTILGPGGGVCQVSTTCFRAAFWAGLPIVERSPHSYRVSWYEPPVGLDAAVFSPSVDTKFQNDADTPLLILTEVDEKNSKLYFRFYGKPSGRKVTLEGPTTSNPVKPGDPIVEQDPSLSPGARVQVETPRDGLDVTLYRIVEQDGTILSKDRFFSRYVPWPARYRVGPPKAEPTAAPQ